jgi:hypothetical protein
MFPECRVNTPVQAVVLLFLIVVFKNEIRCSSPLDAPSLRIPTWLISRLAVFRMLHRTNIPSAKYVSAVNAVSKYNILTFLR